MNDGSISFTFKLAAADHRFLQTLQAQRRLKALGEAMRVVVAAARTLFSLPPYQAERIRRDMEARDQDVVTYLQELLARRYAALALEDQERAGAAGSPADGPDAAHPGGDR